MAVSANPLQPENWVSRMKIRNWKLNSMFCVHTGVFLGGKNLTKWKKKSVWDSTVVVFHVFFNKNHLEREFVGFVVSCVGRTYLGNVLWEARQNSW